MKPVTGGGERMTSARNNEILKHLKTLSDFINNTESDDPMWSYDQAACNVAIDRIKSLIGNCIDSVIIGHELCRQRFYDIEYKVKSDRIYMQATREDCVYGRDFMLDELSLQPDPMQFMVNWFTAHKLKELE